MQHKILKLNKPNGNNRIYTKDSFLNLTENFECFGTLDAKEFPIDLTKISHHCSNFKINEDDELMCDIRILDTECGELLKQLIHSGEFRPVSFGNVKKLEDGGFLVYDSNLQAVSFTNDPA